jgi:hypothetical protein
MYVYLPFLGFHPQPAPGTVRLAPASSVSRCQGQRVQPPLLPLRWPHPLSQSHSAGHPLRQQLLPSLTSYCSSSLSCPEQKK